jgi:hypothetical protein
MNERYVRSHSVLAFAAIVALPGCMQSRVDESRELHTHIDKSEAVVILPKPQVEGAAAEEGFVDCVGGGLAGHGDSAIAVRRHQEFVDSTFPWFEPGTAPSRPEAIEALLTRPGLAEKVAASHVRYIVWLDGGTRKTDGGGSIACGTGCGRLHRLRVVGKGNQLRGDHLGHQAGESRRQRRHRRHRHVRHRRRGHSAALHRARAEHRLQPHGRAAAHLLHGRG